MRGQKRNGQIDGINHKMEMNILQIFMNILQIKSGPRDILHHVWMSMKLIT